MVLLPSGLLWLSRVGWPSGLALNVEGGVARELRPVQRPGELDCLIGDGLTLLMAFADTGAGNGLRLGVERGTDGDRYFLPPSGVCGSTLR